MRCTLSEDASPVWLPSVVVHSTDRWLGYHTDSFRAVRRGKPSPLIAVATTPTDVIFHEVKARFSALDGRYAFSGLSVSTKCVFALCWACTIRLRLCSGGLSA